MDVYQALAGPGGVPTGYRTPTSSTIPHDPANSHYQALQAAVAAGSATIVPPAPPMVRTAEQRDVLAEARTTDATPLEVFRFPCETRHLYRANLRVSGIDSVTFAVKIMEGRFVWKRVLSGAIVTGLTVVSDIHDTAAASWLPNYAADGADVVFTVQGAAGRTIDWLLVGEVGAYAPEGLTE